MNTCINRAELREKLIRAESRAYLVVGRKFQDGKHELVFYIPHDTWYRYLHGYFNNKGLYSVYRKLTHGKDTPLLYNQLNLLFCLNQDSYVHNVS